MYGVWDWFYPRRDLVSYAGAATMVLVVVLASRLSVAHMERAEPTEMLAILELTAPLPPVDALKPEPAPSVDQSRAVAYVPVRTPPTAQPIADPAAPADAAPPISPVPFPPPARTVVASPVPLPPDPPSNSPPASATPSTQYEAQILAYLERVKRYPTSREARLTRPTGTARVWFDLNRKGQLLASGLATSSGSNLLDAEAMRTLRTGNFPPFPETVYPGDEAHRFVAAIKYEVDGPSQ